MSRRGNVDCRECVDYDKEQLPAAKEKALKAIQEREQRLQKLSELERQPANTQSTYRTDLG